METAVYAQFPVNDIVKSALRDFKVDANKLLQDPRLADVSRKIATIPGLTLDQQLRAEELLFQIRYYRTMLLSTNPSRAYQVTRISADKNKANIKEYEDLIQLKIPTLEQKDYLEFKVFPNIIKLPTIEKQMELILDPQPTQLEINLKNENPLIP